MITPCSKELTITVNPPTVPYYAYYKLDDQPSVITSITLDQSTVAELIAQGWATATGVLYFPNAWGGAYNYLCGNMVYYEWEIGLTRFVRSQLTVGCTMYQLQIVVDAGIGGGGSNQFLFNKSDANLTDPSGTYALFDSGNPLPSPQWNGPLVITATAGGTNTTLVDQVSAFDLIQGSGILNPVAGKIGTAFNLGNGVNTQFVNGPDAHWIFSGSFTIRFWIKTSATGGNYFMFGTGDQWNVTFIGGSDILEFIVSTTMGDAYVDTPVLTNGVWHEVFFWWEQGVGCGCKVDNGAAVTSANTDPIDTSFIVDTLYLQNSHFMNPGFAIDEIAIWNHKLTDAEMTIDWNGGAGTTYTH